MVAQLDEVSLSGPTTWKERLSEKVSEDLAREIEIFEVQLGLRQLGRVEEKLFAETRLRRGVYGQRYDNGKRYDGVETRQLEYPEAESKGTNTVWHAPGMQRIKIPYGGLNPEQMETLAEVAEEYADSILHITTRQDVQLHFVHIEDTVNLMLRLAAVGITTRDAGGNVIRNVTACPMAGLCNDEAFDVTPYAHALTYFLLGHADAQNLGRKFKVSFSGCSEKACGLARMHDIGCIAKTRLEDGVTKRGFELYVGGGLGPVPHQGKLFDPFVPEEEILPISQAICRVFARLGEKKNRGRARMKFLVAKLGIDEFRRLVLEERAGLTEDGRWTSFLDDVVQTVPPVAPDSGPLVTLGAKGPLDRWKETNVVRQKQSGLMAVTVSLPLGDITSDQMRALADLSRRYVTRSDVRTTVEQSILLRSVKEEDVPTVYEALERIGLAEPVAGTIVDITACPGTDTCKLGISASRGLAAELRVRMAAKNSRLDDVVRGLRIRISGCFNSCGQHHVSDIGFYGVSRKKGSHQVPHFQVVLGGQWLDNAGSFGMAMGAVPSKRIPHVVDRVTDRYVRERELNESFQAFIKRIGKAEVKKFLQDLTEVPSYNEDPTFYSDWDDPREYSMKDHGVGECAGEMVPPAEFGLQDSERQVFEAQIRLESGDPTEAATMAFRAMLIAAKALVETELFDISDEPTQIVSEFKARFHDTERFHHPFAGGKFASYLFRVHRDPSTDLSLSFDQARQRVEEAQLFIEAAHACYERLERSEA